MRFSRSMLEGSDAALDFSARRPADHDGAPSPLRSSVLLLPNTPNTTAIAIPALRFDALQNSLSGCVGTLPTETGPTNKAAKSWSKRESRADMTRVTDENAKSE